MVKFLNSLVLFLRMTSFWASWRPNQKNPLGYIMGLWYRVVKGRTHNFVYIEKKCRLMGKKIGKFLPSLVLFFGLTAAISRPIITPPEIRQTSSCCGALFFLFFLLANLANELRGNFSRQAYRPPREARTSWIRKIMDNIVLRGLSIIYGVLVVTLFFCG